MEEKLLEEWSEKIYRAAETVWKTLVAFSTFPTREEAEKFRNEMHEKKIGGFITVIQSKAGLLYLKIGDHEMATDYYPSHYHKERIVSFLKNQENCPEIVQEIIMRLATIPIIAGMVRRKILYPEIEELEKKIAQMAKRIAELEEKIAKKNCQLKIALCHWSTMLQEADSALRRASVEIYALRNAANE